MVIELVYGSEGCTCLYDSQTTALRCFGMWHRVVWWTYQVFGLSYYIHLYSVRFIYFILKMEAADSSETWVPLPKYAASHHRRV